jgi:hypothetical protein
MLAGSDSAAVGAAVTVKLCGDWAHEGPCRWPHHTSVSKPLPETEDVVVRVVFACDPVDAGEVRELIIAGIRSSALDSGPTPSAWSVIGDRVSSVRESEAELAVRLNASP